ncbi:hypothetical protein Cadr_000031025 [Camelus dromedarius]|uniref:Uncharacterized protein n=1 Tax=Camelus dromedarius TaxID=9838 RepID=A0A5N4C0F2_CAMDR|nr:hypothetical protein Cadr_000031025 [Camelus dromedarius]
MGNKALSAVLKGHGRNIKKEKTSLLEDIKRLKQDKQDHEADLGKMKTETKPESRCVHHWEHTELGWSLYTRNCSELECK